MRGWRLGRVPVSEGEYRVLKAMAEKGFAEGSLEEASRILGVERSSLASIVFLLRDKGFVEVREVVEEGLELTERGLSALREGLPEARLVEYLARRGGEASVDEVRGALGGEAGVALGQAVRRGFVDVSGGRVKLLVDPGEASRRVEGLLSLLKGVASGELKESVGGVWVEEALRRGLVKRVRRKRLYLRVLGDPRRILENVEPEVSRLTAEMIRSGEWRRVKFRPYNVTAMPPRVLPARKHFLQEFIEMLRDIMRELGFREARGPLVEIELFNFDALFQAQDHPAREIHDSLWVKEPRYASLSPYSDVVVRVRRVHERGWGYKWDERVAARYILRSQTTAVSARVLASKPRPPVRVFTLGKVFRSDAVGPTRLPEFHQLDGIEGDYSYSFRDLLGRLEEIAGMLGLKLRFKPAYFPFTEPSVEGYVRLPNGRWLELFGAGMFRPEVLESLGVDYPVGAWGFGIERLAMAFYGVSDIRKLYTRDADEIRAMRLHLR